MKRKDNGFKEKQTPDHCMKHVCHKNYICKKFFCEFQAISPASYGQTEPEAKPRKGYKCDAFIFQDLSQVGYKY